MSGGTELLALTGAAVQPLLFDGGDTRDNIDGTTDYPVVSASLHACTFYMHMYMHVAGHICIHTLPFKFHSVTRIPLHV